MVYKWVRTNHYQSLYCTTTTEVICSTSYHLCNLFTRRGLVHSGILLVPLLTVHSPLGLYNRGLHSAAVPLLHFTHIMMISILIQQGPKQQNKMKISLKKKNKKTKRSSQKIPGTQTSYSCHRSSQCWYLHKPTKIS